MAEHRIVVPVVGGSSPSSTRRADSGRGHELRIDRDRQSWLQGAPSGIRPDASRRQWELPCAPPARGGEIPIGRYFFVKGGGPPFTLSPRTRGQRTEFAAISFRAFSASPPEEERAARGAPVSDWHRCARAQRNRTRPTEKNRGDGLERRAPLSHFPPVTRTANKVRCHQFSRVSGSPPEEERAARGAPVSDWHRCARAQRNRVPPTEKNCGDGLERRAPLSHFPPVTRTANKVRCHQFSRVSGSPPEEERAARGAPVSDWHRCARAQRNRVPPTEKNCGDGWERRAPLSHFPPVTRTANKVRCHQFSRVQRIATGRRARRQGSASLRLASLRESAAKPRTADREELRGRLGTPTSGRHSRPEACGRHIAVRPHGTPGKGTPTSGRHSGPEACGRHIAVRPHGTPGRKR